MCCSVCTLRAEPDGLPCVRLRAGSPLKPLSCLGMITTFYGAGTEPKPLGVSSGFIVSALQLMHCDTLEVFANRPGGLATAEERHAALGVGLLLRTAVFAHGHACGCTKAEILAINDDGAEWLPLLAKLLAQTVGLTLRRVPY